MANFELVVHYNSPTVLTSRTLLLLTIPIWGVAMPTASAFIWFYVLYKSDYSPIILISCIAILIIFSLACLYALITLMDTRIIVSKNGLRMPPSVTLFSANCNEVPWAKITGLKVQSILPDSVAKLDTPNLELAFQLADKDQLTLLLADIETGELEKFILALNVWLPQAVKDANLDRLKDKLGRRLLEQAPSYTKLWQDELDSRFSATAFVPLDPGYRFAGRYLEVIRHLAFGGLSAVYLCQENGVDNCVLKESVVPANTKPELKHKAKQMFEREAALLLKLDHPQIVKVRGYFSQEDRTYMLLDYAEGKTLRQIVREDGPLKEEQVRSIALSICAPLAYLHNQVPAIIHKDISPENIVLQDDKAILIDFGAANEFLGTATSTMVGKQCYVAPEQFAGHATPASDLYSLGATLYFLLTGCDPVPLSSSSPKAFDPGKIVISGALDEIVRALTELERSERIADAESLKEKLQLLPIQPV
jgi:tRNA A-37 threonylcarbamoyl transferase component Bud32